MTTLSRFQFNAIVRAAIAGVTVATVGSLGYLGIGVSGASDFTLGYLHSDAVLDTRGFTTINQGGPSVPSLGANGLPTGAATLCLSTAPSTSANGPLAPGNYYLNVPSTGQAVTASISSVSAPGGMTLGAAVAQPDGVTLRYPLTVNAGVAGTIAVNFSGVLSAFPSLARDGSLSTAGQPLFSNDALSYYSKFSSLRLLDFLGTNGPGGGGRTDTAWSTRPGAWALHAYGQPYSWEKTIAFINAVVGYPGSQVKAIFANIPGYVDSTYVSSLAALFNSLSLTSAAQLYLQRANEHWNTQFAFWSTYQASAMSELNCLSNYGVTTPAITSVTSDGTNLTFTTVNPVPAYLTTTANCLVVGGAGGFSVGTLASPVVATKTGANTFTVPTALAFNGTGYMGVIFNLASSLVADGVLPDVYHVSNKWFVRLLYQDQQTWSAIRPQDRFFMDTALYGAEAAYGSGNTLIEYAYAAFVGGGSASWLYGAAVGLYIKATSASTTLTALFAELNTLVGGTIDGYCRAHVYQCKALGIHPMAYEAGPDLQSTPALAVAASTDARMGSVVTSMLQKWYSNGGEILNFYTGSPATFSNTTQGGWPALQAYTDLASPKIAALLAYTAQPVSYANVFGAPGSLGLTTFLQNASHGTITNGLLGWYSGSGYFADVVMAVPIAGSYTLSTVGCSKFANSVALYLEPTNATNGTSIGTSTLSATGGGWGTDSSTAAAAVPDPVSVTLSAGIHTLRLVPTTGGGGGAGLLRVDIVKN